MRTPGCCRHGSVRTVTPRCSSRAEAGPCRHSRLPTLVPVRGMKFHGAHHPETPVRESSEPESSRYTEKAHESRPHMRGCTSHLCHGKHTRESQAHSMPPTAAPAAPRPGPQCGQNSEKLNNAVEKSSEIRKSKHRFAGQRVTLGSPLTHTRPTSPCRNVGRV